MYLKIHRASILYSVKQVICMDTKACLSYLVRREYAN